MEMKFCFIWSRKTHFFHKCVFRDFLNLSESISLRGSPFKSVIGQSLSDHFHLSALYLSREYSRKKKISPLNYQIQLRIEEAKTLIKENPRLLFKHVAAQVGYNDPYYFAKLFKQWTGLTLTEYKSKVLE